ncbi:MULTISPECIES: polyprenyl synthetase family protein [Photorhabdus]|uniref:Farnesyl-diphosphate synthase n=1 Tax=Photorhabdus luminescens TaxID=29488 RepID=A0A1G5R8L3_PHOLU|nr:polyprenyl synthetase family protein [Photorhabdus luminescens]SCZ69731.1 farnesyl-diphosphate synthase [Photorhabdus luminescens]
MNVNTACVMNYEETLLELQSALQQHLELVLPSGVPDDKVCAAMRESTLVSGKRIRPLLLLLIILDLGENPKKTDFLQLASAIEIVHAASLILDDLPCMDNAEHRRGHPAIHRQYGESVAILAAVALLSRAFGLIVETNLPEYDKSAVVAILSHAIGLNGLVQGQFRDLNNTFCTGNYHTIATTNDLKTGLLFDATFQLAAIAVNAPDITRQALRHISQHLGQAFQLLDDLNDDQNNTGKDMYQDKEKLTMVTLLGKSKVHEHLRRHIRYIDKYLAVVGRRNLASQYFIRYWFDKNIAMFN